MVNRPNAAKRIQNENVPPPSSRVLNVKSVVSRISRSISRTLRDGQHRRRSETGVQTSKFIVEQAKRRQTKNKIRFNVKSMPGKGIQDVEMADGTFVAPSLRTIPVHLPQELLRPAHKVVTPAMIAAVDPTAQETNVPYFCEGLLVLEKELMQSLANVKIDNLKTKLPNELNVVVNDATVILPSHILAIFGREPAPGSPHPRQVTLYPVHSLVLIAQCAHLPPPPHMLPVPVHVKGEQTLQLPVWSISLPSPQTYPAISLYLYTNNVNRLMRGMLPMPPPDDLRQTHGKTREFGELMGKSYPAGVIVRYVFLIHGLWQNMCALGIFDKQLWDALDAMWNTVLVALAVATGNPSMPIAPYQPLDEGYESAEEDDEDVDATPLGERLSSLSASSTSSKESNVAPHEPETNAEPITTAASESVSTGTPAT